VDEIRVDLKPIKTATKGMAFSMITDQQVRRGDKLYLLEKVATPTLM